MYAMLQTTIEDQLYENSRGLIPIELHFIPNFPIDNNPLLV